MEIQLTYFAIGRLGPLLLTSAISAYLWYRSRGELSSLWLAIYFSCLTAFNLSYFVGYCWNSPYAGYSWYFACIIAFAGVARLQFAYVFPDSPFERERKPVLYISGLAATAATMEYLVRAGTDFGPVFGVHTYGSSYSSLWVPLVSFLCFLGSILVALRSALHFIQQHRKATQSSSLASLKSAWQSDARLRASVFLVFVTSVELGVNTVYLMSRASLLDNAGLAFTMNAVMLLIFGIYVVVYSSAATARTGFMHRLIGITFVTVLGLLSFASVQSDRWFMESFRQKSILIGKLALARGEANSDILFLQPVQFDEMLEESHFDQDGSQEKRLESKALEPGHSDPWIQYGLYDRKAFAGATFNHAGRSYLVGFPYSSFRQELHDSAMIHAVLLLAASGLTLLPFPVLFRGSIIRPIHRLLEDMGKLRGQKSDGRQEGDEILKLRAAFEDMTDMLRTARKELPDFSVHLEELERVVRTEPDLIPTGGGRNMVIRSVAMRRVIDQIRKLQPVNQSVLIHGETGTGKELVARLIGSSSGGPFVAVNCAAIPETLWESELFGHRRGAFTDARSERTGRIAEAAGGVLFLDEIGEMPLNMQAKLLRVLQERVFSPLGAEGTVEARCRFLFATNRDLDSMIKEGSFRQDLLYRINVFTLQLPPLRERPEDIPGLVHYLVDRICSEHKISPPEIPADSLRALMSYSWPGNIRELENLLIRTIVLNESESLAPSQFLHLLSDSDRSRVLPRPGGIGSRTDSRKDEGMVRDSGESTGPDSVNIPYDREIRDYGRAMVKRALSLSGGNKTRAAEILGLKRSTLRNRMKELGLDN